MAVFVFVFSVEEHKRPGTVWWSLCTFGLGGEALLRTSLHWWQETTGIYTL